MCELKRKLLAFDYTIGKLVEWDCEESGRDERASLKNFSNVRLMKSLYSVCAASIQFYDSEGKTLFDLFDNFVAYPRGPVEVDAYGNLSSLLRYSMFYDKDENDAYLMPSNYREEFDIIYSDIKKEGLTEDDFQKNPSQALNILIQKEEKLRFVIPMIDKSIALLRSARGFPPFDDRDKLIDITHLDLWYEAFYSNIDKKLDTQNKSKLNHEFQQFSQKIGLVVA